MKIKRPTINLVLCCTIEFEEEEISGKDMYLKLRAN